METITVGTFWLMLGRVVENSFKLSFYYHITHRPMNKDMRQVGLHDEGINRLTRALFLFTKGCEPVTYNCTMPETICYISS